MVVSIGVWCNPFVGASLFACAWCHRELLGSFTLHSCIIAGAELHLFFDSILYVAGLF
jgi:hypothetical protein